MRYSYLGFGLYGLLLILSFPIRIVPGLLVLGAVLSVGFTLINDKKVSLTQSPITFLDFKITALNPEGLINAVKAPSWTIFLFYILLFIFAIIALWILVNILRVMENGRKKSTFRRLALNALAFILFIGSGVFFLGQFSKSVHEFVIAKDMAWESKSFSDLPRLLSIWGVSLLFISSGENGFRRLF